MRRADRLFQIIQALRRARAPVTAEQLATELEVTKRTIYRDVAALMAQAVPIRGEAGVGYVIDRDFDMPPLMLTPDELEAAVLGAQWVAEHADRALAVAAKDLVAKIAAAVPERLRQVVVTPTLATPPSLAVPRDGLDLERVRAHIRAGRKLRIRYLDLARRETERVVWPVVVGYGEAHRHLVAWCELRSDFRHFRADRVLAAEFLDDRHEQRPDVLLRRWREHADAARAAALR
ncbi:MAG: YafY family transcriptional regulator [Deltaproteobacteria bacterium]|nr:YafY family transcriptional regulator [Deltaproteobacteria bacterium]